MVAAGDGFLCCSEDGRTLDAVRRVNIGCVLREVYSPPSCEFLKLCPVCLLKVPSFDWFCWYSSDRCC